MDIPRHLQSTAPIIWSGVFASFQPHSSYHCCTYASSSFLSLLLCFIWDPQLSLAHTAPLTLLLLMIPSGIHPPVDPSTAEFMMHVLCMYYVHLSHSCTVSNRCMDRPPTRQLQL